MPIGGQIANQVKIENAQVAFSTAFSKAFTLTEDPLVVLASEQTGNTPTVDVKMFSLSRSMREWTDQRQLAEKRAENVQCTAHDFETSERANVNDIMDDNLGAYSDMMGDMGSAAKLHYGELTVDALNNGWSASSPFGLCYDGKPLFSATHQEGEGSAWDNTSTAVFSYDALWTLWEAMASQKDEFERPLRIRPNTLVVGPSLARTAMQALGADLINDGANVQVTNVTGNLKLNLLLSESLIGAYANYWYLADLSRRAKPIGIYKRQTIQLGFSDIDVFKTKEMYVGADSRDYAYYGLPQLIYGSTGGG